MRGKLGAVKPEVFGPTQGARRALSTAVIAALVLRLPSLWDPPWVNDEGTYFAVAQAMAHGYRLYVDVWENKPPALYLLYEAVYRPFGPSLLAVRIIACVAAIGLLLGVWRIASQLMDGERALVAVSLAGIMLAVPFLEGTTANAELFMAVFSAASVWLAVVAGNPASSGAATAIAVLFKAVAGFDALALGIWLTTRQRSRAVPFAVGLAAVLAAAGALAGLAGILPSLVKDALLYDAGYVGHGNGGGVPWLLVIKAAVLAALTFPAWRAGLPYLWLLYATAGTVVSGRLFGHYLIQMIAPLAIVLALHAPRVPFRRVLAALLLAYGSAAAIVAAGGWAMAASGHDSILARRLQYYANVLRLATHQESYAVYRSQIDDHVNRNLRIADALGDAPPGPLLIWGNAPWVYVLSGRLPVTPYTSALRSPEVPGETHALRAAISRGTAREVVVVDPPAPTLGAAAWGLHRHYRPVRRIDNAVIYVWTRTLKE